MSIILLRSKDKCRRPPGRACSSSFGRLSLRGPRRSLSERSPARRSAPPRRASSLSAPPATTASALRRAGSPGGPDGPHFKLVCKFECVQSDIRTSARIASTAAKKRRARSSEMARGFCSSTLLSLPAHTHTERERNRENREREKERE